MDHELGAKLRLVGLDPDGIDDPDAAFTVLAERFGRSITVADRYALEAAALDVDEAALPPGRKDELAREITMLRFPGWEILGEVHNEPIEIVPYDSTWPEEYEAWHHRLEVALGSAALGIDHVGSTAVPGLAAKPTIDIQISVRDMTDEPSYVPAIEGLGVPLRARDDLHRYFRPAPGRPRHVHIHVCDEGGDWERDHLLFRDYLRANDRIRDAYAALKLDLAKRFRDDRLAYTDAKSAFILGALEDARASMDSGSV
jgi:GrpB-like predicted nucleotidyltransferase (UPF0157 family)